MEHGGRIVAKVLRSRGVSHLFTLSGGHLFSIYDGCKEEGIEIVDVRHEQTAAFAAEGFAKATRRVGVAALTAGPGVTNGLSAIAGAQANGSPISVLEVHRAQIGVAEDDLAAGGLLQPDDGPPGGGLPAAGFADDGHRLTAVDAERDPVDGLDLADHAAHGPALDGEVLLQAPHLEQRTLGRLARLVRTVR
jgi:hypothetical protein